MSIRMGFSADAPRPVPPHLAPESLGFGRHRTVRRYGPVSGLIPVNGERRRSSKRGDLQSSDPYVSDSATFRGRNGRKQFWDERLKIPKAIGMSTQDNDCDGESRKILLEREIPVDGDEYVKFLCDQRKQLAVLNG